MKKLLLPLLLLSLLSGCTDEYRIERKEDRLVGDWVFEKAFYRESGDIFRENLLEEYEGDILSFYRDYTCEYDDRDNRQYFPGDWELFLDHNYFDDEDDIEFFLDVIFYDRDGRVGFSWNAQVTLLTHERMNLRVPERSGVYTFKLCKR